jgi:hypothetical protein
MPNNKFNITYNAIINFLEKSYLKLQQQIKTPETKF